MDTKLRQIRKNLRITQSDLAKRAHITTPILSDIELGKRVPSQNAAIRLSIVLGMSNNELFPGLVFRKKEAIQVREDRSPSERRVDKIDYSIIELLPEFRLLRAIFGDMEIFERAKKFLTVTEARVIELRFGFDNGHSKTLEQVGQIFGVTRERIRQIESKAFRKLRPILRLPLDIDLSHYPSRIVYQNPNKEAIDKALVERMALRKIEAQFGVSRSSLSRYNKRRVAGLC